MGAQVSVYAGRVTLPPNHSAGSFEPDHVPEHRHDAGQDHSARHERDRPQAYGHEHEHEHGVWGQLGAWLAPHSHDSTDLVDNTLEASSRGMRALWISFAGLMVTAVRQAGVVVFTGSVALLGDTVHNFADALTAVPLAIAFVLGRRADVNTAVHLRAGSARRISPGW